MVFPRLPGLARTRWAARPFQRLAVQVGVRIGDNIQSLVQTKRPQNRKANTDRRAWLAEFQRSECVAIDASLAGKVRNRPAAPNARDPDTLTQVGNLLGSLDWHLEIAHFARHYAL